MLILNHPEIAPLHLVFVDSKEGIKNSLPNDFLILQGNFKNTLSLARILKENAIPYAAFVTKTTEALMLVNLEIKFLLTHDIELAKSLQKLAETYLFDSKILLCGTYNSKEHNLSNHAESLIESAANFNIDGVLFV